MVVVAEMGLVGILLILSVYILILRRSIRLYQRLGPDNLKGRGFVILFWGFLAVYIVNSVFIEMRYFEFVNGVFFISAGFICRMGREYDAKAC
jgi:O-antigen ligase